MWLAGQNRPNVTGSGINSKRREKGQRTSSAADAGGRWKKRRVAAGKTTAARRTAEAVEKERWTGGLLVGPVAGGFTGETRAGATWHVRKNAEEANELSLDSQHRPEPNGELGFRFCGRIQNLITRSSVKTS